MIRLTILTTFLCMNFALAEVSALWWNIGFNDYSKPTSSKNITTLDQTLMSYSWKNYNVIALGEYVKGTLHKRSLTSIKSLFPFSKVINYNQSYGKSIYLFSKTPFDLKVQRIGWANPYDRVSAQRAYMDRQQSRYGKMNTFERKYIRMETVIEDKKYNFVFYHLNNPWVKYKKKIGKYRTAFEIVFGTNNPLYNQLLHLKEKLIEDFGVNYKDENIVMLGDSNCPSSVKGLISSCYTLMENILSAKSDQDRADTFPAIHSKVGGKFPSVKIDHAQVSSSLVERSELTVLNLKGSDHLPLSLKIKN